MVELNRMLTLVQWLANRLIHSLFPWPCIAAAPLSLLFPIKKFVCLGVLLYPQAKERICRLIQSGIDSGAKLALDGRNIVVYLLCLFLAFLLYQITVCIFTVSWHRQSGNLCYFSIPPTVSTKIELANSSCQFDILWDSNPTWSASAQLSLSVTMIMV